MYTKWYRVCSSHLSKKHNWAFITNNPLAKKKKKKKNHTRNPNPHTQGFPKHKYSLKNVRW